jgi:YHS domain-containing protein
MEPKNKIPAEAVCHRSLTGNPSYNPRAEYQGQTIYFCTGYCQRAFLEDPQRFYQAHGKVRGEPSGCEFNPEGAN